MSDAQPLVIVAGVLVAEDGQVLVTTRPEGRAMAGFQEFPGGKREAGEGRWETLVRELGEELGIRPLAGRPLIRLRHDYRDGPSVDLDFWQLDSWEGDIRPLEGQRLIWRAPADLDPDALLPANRPVLTALRLPPRYLVTPAPAEDGQDCFLEALERSMAAQGAMMVQLRGRWLHQPWGVALAQEAVARIHAQGHLVMINGDIELTRQAGADGVHFTAQQLRQGSAGALPGDLWVGASCHDAEELERAARLGADFATLGHVRTTPSHPGGNPLGWEPFAALVHQAGLPVYGIGGLGEADLAELRALGAQGYAAIRGLWAEGSPGGAAYR